MTTPRTTALPGTSPAPSTGQIAISALPPRPQPRVPVPPATGLREDPSWHRTAVFYEVMIRSFSDSRGDGSGDLRGPHRPPRLPAVARRRLPVAPPFYPSPMRDGGYDVSDYTAIAPNYGSTQDFVELIEAAHARGIRLVVDLVMNHTSDAHPWFQASRSDPEGPYGDFYVWSDDNTRYGDARIIFVDTETSNWTFDPVRRQYFWHRFFSHQPDLNFDNPRVVEAMVDVARFWLRPGRGRVPAGRGPVPVRGRGHQLREPARDARLPAPPASGHRRRVPGPHHAGRGEPVAARTSSSTSAPRRSPSATCASTSR